MQVLKIDLLLRKIIEKRQIFLALYNNSIYFCDILKSYHMKTLSLKLDDNIFNETEDILARIKKSRNRYINEAVDYYNRVNRRALIAKRLAKESRIVSKESLLVLNEFESIPYED